MSKTRKPGGASVRESKAAALDTLVKKEQESERALLAAKKARLKALRLARDAAELAAPKAKAAPKEKTTTPKEAPKV